MNNENYKNLPKQYNPADYEDKIYKKWEQSGYFNPDNLDCAENAKSYTIILPPPNITDKLHLGHASGLSIQDLLIRYHRMKGYRALWLPGTDHAAIATQNAVEKRLFKEKGKTRHDLGRDKFLAEIWDFLKKTQVTILNQTRKMGASLDWSREAFTFDKPRQKAVSKMFIDMYKEGVIYRGERIVNWCPRCKSTLADDEVEYKPQKTFLYTFKYEKSFPFTIATTRPETKLGDTAVAVNPKDERYKQYIDKTYEVDFLGTKLKLKIIADREVDMKFGTGALGVTPAHSMADWQMAEKNDLQKIKVINEDGIIHDNFSKYSKKSVSDARKLIVQELRDNNLLEKEEEIENNLSICYRCDTPIEPLPSKQWFISVDKKLDRLGGKSLKEKAIAVGTGHCPDPTNKTIKFVPNRFTKRYTNWMTNLHDWCISRQIWFGHRVPIWYDEKGKIHLPTTQKITFARHGESEWNRDEIIQGSFQKGNNLTDKGIKQAEDLANEVKNKKITKIICSDLNRAKETAEIVGEKLNIPIEIWPELQEVSYGEYESKSLENFFGKGINYFDYEKLIQKIIVKNDPQIETVDSIKKRAQTVLKKLEKEQDEEILIISHGSFLGFVAAEQKNINDKYLPQFFQNWRMRNGETIEVTFEKEPIGDNLTQDSDTLDTWFSSGMWTFSTLGWPDNFQNGNKQNDLAKFHPTQVLETGYEIITLWVSRMIMMSLFATKEIPFENVYLHGMVLDEHGKKMSKSKGNGIDPIEVIDEFGTDAVRLALLIGNTPGNDTRISKEKIASFRNFANKLWNISRFILSTQGGPALGWQLTNNEFNIKNLTTSDQWILTRLNNIISEVTNEISNYNFSQAGEKLKEFTWNDFADWYLEVSKFEKTEQKDEILIYILENLLKLWHPFMPFVTEAIWETMDKDKLLMVESFPTPNSKFEFKDANQFELVQNIIIAIRNARAENKVEPGKKIKAIICAKNDKELLEKNANIIKNLRTGIEELTVETRFIASKNKPDENAIHISIKNIDIYLIGARDEANEKERIKKEKENLEKLIKNQQKKLANKEFTKKAPQNIVQKEQEKLKEWEEEYKKLS